MTNHEDMIHDGTDPSGSAEEAVLYPAVEAAMAAPGATATMRADHAEIVARIGRLADTATSIDRRWSDTELARDLGHQLVGLAAILNLHLRKEEEVLLPHLDASLSADDADTPFTRMAGVAHKESEFGEQTSNVTCPPVSL